MASVSQAPPAHSSSAGSVSRSPSTRVCGRHRPPSAPRRRARRAAVWLLLFVSGRVEGGAGQPGGGSRAPLWLPPVGPGACAMPRAAPAWGSAPSTSSASQSGDAPAPRFHPGCIRRWFDQQRRRGGAGCRVPLPTPGPAAPAPPAGRRSPAPAPRRHSAFLSWWWPRGWWAPPRPMSAGFGDGGGALSHPPPLPGEGLHLAMDFFCRQQTPLPWVCPGSGPLPRKSHPGLPGQMIKASILVLALAASARTEVEGAPSTSSRLGRGRGGRPRGEVAPLSTPKVSPKPAAAPSGRRG